MAELKGKKGSHMNLLTHMIEQQHNDKTWKSFKVLATPLIILEIDTMDSL